MPAAHEWAEILRDRSGSPAALRRIPRGIRVAVAVTYVLLTPLVVWKAPQLIGSWMWGFIGYGFVRRQRRSLAQALVANAPLTSPEAAQTEGRQATGLPPSLT